MQLMAGLPGSEFGLMGLVLMALVGALVWHMRVTTTELMRVVRDNTAALIELRETLRGKVVSCPLVERQEDAGGGSGGPAG